MRKYEYKESRNFAQILGMVNALQIRRECAAKYFNKPLEHLKHKLCFYGLMLKILWMLKKSEWTDFISVKDYIKLKEMWLSILKRTYEPRY